MANEQNGTQYFFLQYLLVIARTLIAKMVIPTVQCTRMKLKGGVRIFLLRYPYCVINWIFQTRVSAVVHVGVN